MVWNHLSPCVRRRAGLSGTMAAGAAADKLAKLASQEKSSNVIQTAQPFHLLEIVGFFLSIPLTGVITTIPKTAFLQESIQQ